jgi:predicted transposase/invertase (TIGR01784 family)
VILDTESLENDLKDFSFTFLELPKFNKDMAHLRNMSDKWIYFFKHAEETSENDVHKLIDHDQIIERAFGELNRFSWNEEDLRAYEQAEKYEGAYLASLAQKFDEGEAKGKVEGKAEGRAEGKAEGRAEERYEIAKNMLIKGLEAEIICELTGLSTDAIKALKMIKQ